MRMSKNAKKAVFCCAILILVLVLIYCGLRILESNVYSGSSSQDAYVSKTITRDGIDYFPRQDITVMMVLGIDQQNGAGDSGKPFSDLAMLLIFDQSSKELRILNLDPDTMLNSPGGDGESELVRLAETYSFGSDPKDGCERTGKAISNFLYGIEIDHYLSLNYEAIAHLNDAVGGVTVTVEDDLSQADSTIPKGTVTLRGEQAISYIRSHRGAEDQADVSRMKRQQDYARGFLEAFRDKSAQDPGFILSAFETVSSHLVSDCSVITLASFMARYSDYELLEILHPEGETVTGTQDMEFHVDEQQLDELILRLFYAPK